MSYRMQMDTKNTVQLYYELGMTDPFKMKKSIKDALSEIGTFDFFTEVYPSSVMKSIIEAVKDNTNVQPPKCIFVPDPMLIKQMIKALLKFGTKDS
jgi:hypothetical protein